MPGISSTPLADLRRIKNNVVGDKRAKLQLVASHGHVDLERVLASDSDVRLKIEAAEILGIISFNEPEAAKTLIESLPLVQDVYRVLSTTESKELQLRCLQLLNSVFQSTGFMVNLPDVLRAVQSCVELLSDPSDSLPAADVKLTVALSELIGLARQVTGSADVGDSDIGRLYEKIGTLFYRRLTATLSLPSLRDWPLQGSRAYVLESLIRAVTAAVRPEDLREEWPLLVENIISLGRGRLSPSNGAKEPSRWLVELVYVEQPDLRLAAIELLAHISTVLPSAADTAPATLGDLGAEPEQRDAGNAQTAASDRGVVSLDDSKIGGDNPEADVWPSVQDISDTPYKSWQRLIEILLPLTAPLVSSSNRNLPRVGHVMSAMCRDSERGSLQLVESGIVTKLATMFSEFVLAQQLPAAEALALVLASVASHSDDLRRQIFSAELVDSAGALLKLSQNTQQAVRAKVAASQILRVLSRSVNLLKTAAAFEDITKTVAGVLNETANPEIGAAAMSVVCNLILELSPAQKQLLDLGVLPKIIAATAAEYTPLRVNAVWALKHACFEASDELRLDIMQQLGVNRLLALCQDPGRNVQVHALGFLRNYTAGYRAGVEFCLAEIGNEDMYHLLRSKLSADVDVAQEAVYVLAHVAAGPPEHRHGLAEQSALLSDVLSLARGGNEDILLAVFWLVANLTWGGDLDGTAAMQQLHARGAALSTLGYVDFLQGHVNSSYPKISERAAQALAQLRRAISGDELAVVTQFPGRS